MKKNQKLQALKKELLNQNFQSNPNIKENKKEVIKQKSGNFKRFNKLLFQKKEFSDDLTTQTNKYTVENNPYVKHDLRKILIFSSVTIFLLIILYIIRGSKIISNLSDQIYSLLHL